MPGKNPSILSAKDNPSSDYGNLAYHPYNVMLMLVLLAVTAIFLSLSIAFVYTRMGQGEGAIKIPRLFVYNTLFLLAGSYMMWRAKNEYDNDGLSRYLFSLRLTILLTVVFLSFQILAWKQLFAQNIFLATSNSTAYLYLLTGLHFAHVLAGLPFLARFIMITKRQTREPHQELVYFSDPERRLKLRLLRIYWHFLDGLWVFLVLFFLVNYWFG